MKLLCIWGLNEIPPSWVKERHLHKKLTLSTSHTYISWFGNSFFFVVDVKGK